MTKVVGTRDGVRGSPSAVVGAEEAKGVERDQEQTGLTTRELIKRVKSQPYYWQINIRVPEGVYRMYRSLNPRVREAFIERVRDYMIALLIEGAGELERAAFEGLAVQIKYEEVRREDCREELELAEHYKGLAAQYKELAEALRKEVGQNMSLREEVRRKIEACPFVSAVKRIQGDQLKKREFMLEELARVFGRSCPLRDVAV